MTDHDEQNREDHHKHQDDHARLIEPLPQDPPDWLLRELAEIDQPDGDVLRRFSYLLEAMPGEQRALTKCYSKAADWRVIGEWVVDAIFTTTGRLLNAADDLFVVVGATTRYASARGIDKLQNDQEPSVGSLVGGVGRRTADIEIRAEWRIGNAVPEIEIVVVGKDRAPMRPLRVRVVDDKGAQLADLELTPLQGNPRFPAPQPGIYEFQLDWPGGRGELKVAVCSGPPDQEQSGE
jgi:hypothetical protein